MCTHHRTDALLSQWHDRGRQRYAEHQYGDAAPTTGAVNVFGLTAMAHAEIVSAHPELCADCHASLALAFLDGFGHDFVQALAHRHRQSSPRLILRPGGATAARDPAAWDGDTVSPVGAVRDWTDLITRTIVP